MMITSDKRLLSWGLEDCLGRPGKEFEPAPVRFPFDVKVVDVACTEYACSCIDELGRIWTWGGFRVIRANQE
jgi:alpha-tubulin suppressor-like RCC1 family protein